LAFVAAIEEGRHWELQMHSGSFGPIGACRRLIGFVRHVWRGLLGDQ